ncbi:glycine betaine ABC transporter substrate-binding protein [Bryobacter aggregatus]|uniref:glycine betaine ABC transporter substrate-binding protein n=1 Tax=Bryobacter aggregatus TaxID=360054 RepID=UPI0009B5C059|nr:glycine betaine ABC transporter substrate-binding protein [Bryobacter aggregatus]
MDRRKVLLLTPLALTRCGPHSGITVGAKNFVEQDILGEILAKQLASFGVRKKLHLGGSFVAHEALISGAIDLYPEYTGTALSACLKLPLTRTGVFETVKKVYAERYQVEWGWRLGFANTFAMVVKQSEGIRSLSDAVQRKKGWRLGVGYEFEQRPDGWQSFRKTYPLRTSGELKTMDLGLIYRALANGDVDMVAGNSTDPALVDGNFVALVDDQNFFPPYEACLAVRQDALQRVSGLRAKLDQLTGKIPVEQMRKWNAEVSSGRASAESIAAGVTFA